MEYLKANHGEDAGPDDAIIDFKDEKGIQRKVTAREQAALELEGKAPELRTIPTVEFDFLVCCGGANDPIRNKYLGFPKEETIPKGYGVAVFAKGDKFRDAHFLPEGKEGRIHEKMDVLQPHLAAQQFNALIESSEFLSPALRSKYAQLTELILRGPVEDETETMAANGVPHYRKDLDGKFILGNANLQDREVQLRIFENKLTFYTGAETPAGLFEFFKDLEIEKKGLPKDSPNAQKYDALKREIDKKWFAAIAYNFMTDGHPENAGIINMERKQNPDKINFDPMPINTGTFPVVQYAVEKAAKELEFVKYGVSLIITVLGDARANPHFFTGSGMSTGRLGIENTATLVKDYHTGNITKKELVSQLDSRLDRMKLQVLKKGGHYVKKSPPEKKAAAAVSRNCQCVNETCALLSKTPLEGEHAFRIIRDADVTPNHPQFKLALTQDQGKEVTFDVEVTANGYRCREVEYGTILDTVIALKHS